MACVGHSQKIVEKEPMKNIHRIIFLAALFVSAAMAEPPSKVYIEPMQGNLDGFLAAEIIKQHLPMEVTTDAADADFILTGVSIKGDDSFRRFNGSKDRNEGNIRLLNVKEKRMVWAAEAGDRSMFYAVYHRGGERKLADRLIKRMKKDLF